jgi:diguanylate cyclase (GGDEF)-like protein/PAS domain S-box-containing protein
MAKDQNPEEANLCGVQTHDLDHFARLIAQRGGDSVVFTDVDGLVVWANPAFKTLSGFSVEELRGRKPGQLLQGPGTDPQTVEKIRKAVRDREVIRTEILNYSKAGIPYWIDILIQPIFDDNDKLIHFMSIERDISVRRRLLDQMGVTLEQEKKRRQERKLLSQASEWFYMAEEMSELRAVVAKVMAAFFPSGSGALYVYSNSRDMLERECTWGLETTPPFLRANECWALRRGRAYDFGVSRLDFRCSHADPHSESYYCLPIVALGDTIGLLYLQSNDCTHSTSTRDLQTEAHPESWELSVILAEQISLALAKVRVQAQLRDSSVKDALTGLWNRRWFDDALRREIDACKNQQVPLSIVYLDVDHFKRFNDENGHAAGDEVLRRVGEVMSKNSSRHAYSSRIGGEEFAILCPSLTGQEAIEIADKVRSAIFSTTIVSGGAVLNPVTASAGVAQYVAPETATDLALRADLALYDAKGKGRNRTELARDQPSQGSIDNK